MPQRALAIRPLGPPQPPHSPPPYLARQLVSSHQPLATSRHLGLEHLLWWARPLLLVSHLLWGPNPPLSLAGAQPTKRRHLVLHQPSRPQHLVPGPPLRHQHLAANQHRHLAQAHLDRQQDLGVGEHLVASLRSPHLLEVRCLDTCTCKIQALGSISQSHCQAVFGGAACMRDPSLACLWNIIASQAEACLASRSSSSCR